MKRIIKNRSGFTLIEFLLVLSLIGILLTLSTAGLQKLINKYKIQVSANELLSYLRKSKQLSITNHETYGIQLISNKEYGLFKDGEPGYLEKIELEKGIVITHSRTNKKTTFSPLGTAYSGTFTIKTLDGSSIDVVISYSGKIRLDRGD